MTKGTKFPRLLEPGYIGSVKTRNRMIKTGALTGFSGEKDDERVNDTVKSYYEAIARGGIGLLIIESPVSDYPRGTRRKKRMRIDDDRYIPGLSELTQVVHKHGCPIFMQMNHDGPFQQHGWDPPGVPPLNSGPPVASSPMYVKSPNDFNNEEFRALTIPEIEEIIDKYSSAGVRAKKAGFDGVDINAGCTHLMSNFMSPFWNKREDIYGGSLENRTRFITSIIKEMKNRAGKDFAISVCINGIEIGKIVGIEDDKFARPEEIQRTAQIIQEAGADAIMVRTTWVGRHICDFIPDSIFLPEPPVDLNPYKKKFDWSRGGAGAQVPFAALIKRAVSIPVIAVGKIEAELGEKVLREGKADFIGMTRSIIADPEFPNKVIEGRIEDIAPCTACLTCLEPKAESRQCRINAAFGSSESYLINPAEQKKKVVVVGGGPSGMEASRVAALRGHEVILYEKTRELGGLVPLASMLRETEIQDILPMIRYLKTQITRLGVKIRLGQEFNASLVETDKPDVLILAAGGIPALPDIPGINNKIVLKNDDLHRQLKFYLKFMNPDTLRQLTRLWMPIGKRVVVIGAGKQGFELAEFLVKRGRKVTIVDTAEPFTKTARSLIDNLNLEWFERRKVPMFTGVRSIEITNYAVRIVTKDRESKTIEADNVIPVLPLIPNTAIVKNLEGKVKEIYAVGDCKEAGLIVDAISSGWRVARKL
jgi:2,4-dienoyl-CoA reductase (NADPH2)